MVVHYKMLTAQTGQALLRPNDMSFERYQQYYKGIKVEGANGSGTFAP